MGLIVALNRLFRLCTKLFFAVVALGVATIFLLMALSLVAKGSGSPSFQHLIHSDGFFPWPVAAMFSLMELAPWLMGIGLVGAVIGYVLRSLIFRNSERLTAELVSISQTGTKVNGNPMMQLKLRLGTREVNMRTLIDLGNMPRPGDQVWLLVSRADPSFMRYAGIAR